MLLPKAELLRSLASLTKPAEVLATNYDNETRMLTVKLIPPRLPGQ